MLLLCVCPNIYHILYIWCFHSFFNPLYSYSLYLIKLSSILHPILVKKNIINARDNLKRDLFMYGIGPLSSCCWDWGPPRVKCELECVSSLVVNRPCVLIGGLSAWSSIVLGDWLPWLILIGLDWSPINASHSPCLIWGVPLVGTDSEPSRRWHVILGWLMVHEGMNTPHLTGPSLHAFIGQSRFGPFLMVLKSAGREFERYKTYKERPNKYIKKFLYRSTDK